MDPVEHALLAVTVMNTGDRPEADRLLATAHQEVRTAARRDRQIVEIATLVCAQRHARAQGLAFVHGAEFPDDAALLRRITESGCSAPGSGCRDPNR